MKLTKIILLSILFISCKEKIDNKAITKTNKNDSIITKFENKVIEDDKDKTIEIGDIETYQKLPKLAFTSISENEFNKIKANEFIDNYKPKEKGNYLYINIENKTHQFKKYQNSANDNGWNGFVFLGFYPKLNLFALTDNTSTEGLGFGTLFFIDKTNDFQYKIISFGDGSVELPIPSPNNKFMVYYYNGLYQHKNCDIGLLKINDKSNPKKYFSEYSYYQSNDFAVEKIVWKSDNCFYVKGYEEIYENENWVKKYKFYKTDFK